MPKNFRIAHRLWLSVFLIIAMLLVMMGYSAYKNTQLQTEADALNLNMDTRVQAALRWSGLTETNAARTTALIVSSDPAVEAEFKDAIAATSAQITEVQKTLEAMNLSDADKAQMAKIAAARSAMIALRGDARKLKDAGAHDQAVALVKSRYNPAVDTYLQSLRDFVRQQIDSTKLAEEQMTKARMQVLQAAVFMVVLLLLGIVVGAYFLITSIQQPLAQARSLAEHIAAGDLSQQANITRGDEFGELLRSLYTMSHALGRMVHEVRQRTDSITTASAEIATGNHDLSARTEQTSSNLQETAAAMEQFTSTLQQSASSALQASSLAVGATGVAQRGGAVVTQVVSTMEDINHSSKKIADIIGVIDGIAFQTNILALNAAVEAARAGEQGRGFAVVASEVRSLAQRSADAAKEIKQLINASVEKVEAGTRLVSDAGATMTDIVQSVQRVTDMIGEITSASQEQSSGVVQVNQSIGQLDQMTQQNAALVEQSAAAAQSMREQADHLSQVVATFKVNAASYGSAQAAIGAARTSAASLARPAAPNGKAGAVSKPQLRGAARPQASSAGKSVPAALPSSPASAKPAATAGAQRAAADADWESF